MSTTPTGAPITAAEALQVTKGVGKEALPEIYAVIRKAAEAGQTYAHYYKDIGAGAKAMLEGNGFIVKYTNDQRDGGFHTIHWGPQSR